MKSIRTILLGLMTAIFLSLPALADAALPPKGYRFRQWMDNALVPIVIAVVIIAIGILVKVLRSKKK